jgi:hypothetical protein
MEYDAYVLKNGSLVAQGRQQYTHYDAEQS